MWIESAKRGARDAFAVALILYFAFFIVLLGYRLETRWYYTSKQERQQKQNNANNNAGVVPTETTRSDGKKIVYREPSLTPYRMALQELMGEIESANQLLEQNLEQLGQQMTALEAIQSDFEAIDQKIDEVASKPDIMKGKEDTKAAQSLEAVKSLLTMRSLDQVKDPERLKSMFEKASSELSSVFSTTDGEGDSDSVLEDAAYSVYLDTLFKDMAVRTREASAVEGVCPNSSSKAKGKRNLHKLHPDAVTEAELDNYLHKFDSLFQRRTQNAGVRALSPDNESKLVESIEEQIRKTIGNVITQAQDLMAKLKDNEAATSIDGKASITADTDNGTLSVDDCIDNDFIYSLVEAGIHAQLSGGDIREALLKRVGEVNPAAAKDESLILDADLPLKTSTNAGHPYSSSRSLSPINLRDGIDTPLLVKSINWIDQLVDVIGGHNDNLDRYLDTLMTEYGPRASIGEIIVQRLLERVGYINIDPGSVSKYLPSGSAE